MSPPIRKKKDQEALWKGIEQGIVEVVATDHCPFCMDQKKMGWFLQQIRDSSAPDVEILNKPAQKSTLLFPRTVAQIRGGTYTLETLLLR
jgi:hypothetical protein